MLAVGHLEIPNRVALCYEDSMQAPIRVEQRWSRAAKRPCGFLRTHLEDEVCLQLR